MPNETEENLYKQLIEIGYDEETIKKAILHATEKNIESIVHYIEKMEDAQKQITRKKNDENEKNKKEREEELKNREEERKKKENERMKEKLYSDSVKEQIRAELQYKLEAEKKYMDSVRNSSNQSEQQNKPRVNKELCKVKVRFENGVSVLFLFKRDDLFSCLFRSVQEYLKCCDFTLYDGNLVEIEKNDKTFYEMECYPSRVLIARKNK